ncbi:hypothetical protein O0L34_g7925 [Tuta absoluta]|nr:hypothetical protein O0L34_g7925 [Tuta absoluta]
MLFFALFLALAHASFAQLQVNTSNGLVIGNNATDGNYYTFYGLHYGGNTAGANRFKSPTPAPSYPGDFHAHDSSIICAQPSDRGIIGTEDCLTVDVFTNGTTPAKPVVVWLEGEEYTKTSSSKVDIARTYARLVTEGLVVVRMNYRLSIFGFLCLGVPEAPGNAGLKDIVQGLKWIQQNIAAFGGDPNNVVLFGHGSGAAMADLMTMSPMATGLFHKVIAQSGSALAPWAVSYNPVQYAQAFGEKLGYTDRNNSQLANHLASSSLDLFVSPLMEFQFRNNTILFAPCVEKKDLNPNDTFLQDAPLNILRSGNYIHVPYIAGYTDKEGTMRAEQGAILQPSWLELMQTNFTDFLPADLDLSNNLTNVQKSIRDFYFEQRPIDINSIQDFLAYQGDTLVLVSVIRGAKERAATSTSEVRLLEFAHIGTQNSDWPYHTVPLTGARHGIVLNYLLNQDLNQGDIPVMNALVRRFVSFMNTGTPVNPGSQEWLPIRNDSLQYFLISGSSNAAQGISPFSEESRTSPHTQKMTLWNDIYFKYYVAPQAVPASSVRYLGVTLVVLISQILLGLF